jgi:outer membrane receptor for Fe3+-dicitrate
MPHQFGHLGRRRDNLCLYRQPPDLEQAAYVQDFIRLGNWTVNAGLRWDHYQLLVNQNAVSPRVAISRYFPTLGLNLHGSYDRIFQTPSFENILLSSSPAAESLDTSVPQCNCRSSLLTETIMNWA